jgi:glycosyltransferase involved in cell wall biosynthesis
MTLRISVIVPTHDRPDGLAAAVESLLRQTRLPDELIVINDGQADLDASLAARAIQAGVKFLTERRAVASAAASRNRGLELASGDVAVLLDDDVEAPREFLSRLESLYQADQREQVAGICGYYVEPQPPRIPRRVWEAIAAAFAENRWAPRLSAARYVRLPGALARRLRPTWRLVGGVMSLRRRVYATARFTEAFGGYSLAEDTELSFRLGTREALFFAPQLGVLHRKAATGRPDPYRRGRMYAANMLSIARTSVQGGAGTWLLLGYHLVGMIVLASVWALLSRRGHNLQLARGIAAELFGQCRQATGRFLCGC